MFAVEVADARVKVGVVLEESSDRKFELMDGMIMRLHVVSFVSKNLP